MIDNNSLELAANIWPIADETSGLIQRVAARAYAFPKGDDALISATMLNLAGTDWVTAKQYPIPQEMEFVTEHGSLKGLHPIQPRPDKGLHLGLAKAISYQ